MRCVLPWLDSWAAKKPDAAAFEDEKTSARAADKLRVTGQQLPAPMYADYEMADILLKACAFKPEDRYQTPQELQEALLE